MSRPPTLDLKPYFVTLDELDGLVDWGRFFGNDNPVEIDVGSGRGLFLVTAGTAHPDINYVGVELDYKEGRRAARRIKKREMPNVRVVGGDMRVFFDEHVRPGSVAAVHVYFPDPWWKRRHRRRRVFTDQLVSQMAAALKPGGLLHSWTDVEEYFVVISALMDNDPRFESLPAPPETLAEHDLDYRTSFERRKRKAGCKICRGLWRLKSST